MAQKISKQNLDRFQKIVEASGVPTQYFIQFIQRRGGDVLTIDELLAELKVIVDAFKDNEIIAGDYLAGGGNLVDGDVTLNHEESGVTPGIYGDANNIPQLVLDEFGHVTGAIEIPFIGGGVSLEEAGVPVAGSPFSTLNLISGATVVDAGGGVADLTFVGGGGSGGLVLLQEQLLAADASSITFPGLSGAHNDLVIVANLIPTATNTAISFFMRYNGDTGATYDRFRQNRYGITGPSSGQTAIEPGAVAPYQTAGTREASTDYRLEIFNYATSRKTKNGLGHGSLLFTTSGGFAFDTFDERSTFAWTNAAGDPVTQLDFFLSTGNFKAGTKISVYGRG